MCGPSSGDLCLHGNGRHVLVSADQNKVWRGWGVGRREWKEKGGRREESKRQGADPTVMSDPNPASRELPGNAPEVAYV